MFAERPVGAEATRTRRRRRVWPFATTFERPRNAASVPSVVINALTPDDGDEEPVQHADPDRRGDGDDHGEAETVAQGEVRDDHRGEGGDRADREVELAGGHQQRPGRRDDPDHGDRGEDVEPVVPAEEVRRLEREEDRLGDQEDDECGGVGQPAEESRARPTGFVSGRPAAAVTRPPPAQSLDGDLVAGEVGADRPAGHHDRAVGDLHDLLVVGRDHEDAHAVGGELPDRAIDLRTGADVDTARRLDEDENPRAGLEPSAEEHLLLVAARERPDRLVRVVAGANAEDVVPAPIRVGLHPGGEKLAGARETGPRRRGQILRHGADHERAVVLSVGREEADARTDRLGGAVELDRL